MSNESMAEKSRNAGLAARVIHPLLFAVYPVAFLLAQNIDEMAVSDSFRAFVVAALYGLIVWGVARVLIRNPHKAGAIAGLLILATYLYADYSAARWQIAAVLAAVGGLVALIAMSRMNWQRWTVYLNVVAVILMLVSVAQIVPYAVSRAQSSPEASAPLARSAELAVNQSQADRPNIYFVILDGYGRQDVLERFYGFDNAEFVDFLRGQGFYVADRARSNYARTILSVVSTLYFSHLDEYIERNNLSHSQDLMRLVRLLSGSPAHRILNEYGYTTYAFSSTIIQYPADRPHVPDTMFSYFEHEVAERTPFAPVLDWIYKGSAHRMHYDAIKETVSLLHDSIEYPSPKFVMAHLVCPHPPFVFAPDGSFHDVDPDNHRMTDGNATVGDSFTAEDYRAAYVDQVRWLNSEMTAWITKVRQADPDAIIVLQADHGPGSMLRWESLEQTNMLERFSILNALYLPDNGQYLLYPEISTVNTFRVIFNRYFGADYPMLPDTSYFSESGLPLLLYNIRFHSANDTKTQE